MVSGLSAIFSTTVDQANEDHHCAPAKDGKDQIAALVEDARAGNSASLNRLVDAFHKDIFRMVCYRTRSRMDAEDLTQDIFMQMLKSLPGLKDPARFKPWLFRIALNRISDFHRKNRFLNFFSSAGFDDDDHTDTATDRSAANSVIQKEFWEQVHTFAGTLSRWEREVFILRFMDQMGIKEIAETLKKNENTVKTYLYRALKKFRQSPGFYEYLSES
jgi:RNA polymerase sigma-70 factor (ECF subfamily)